MMKSVLCAVIVAALVPAASGDDTATRDPTVAIDLMTMGRLVSVSIGRPTTFTQSRDVPEGLVFPVMRVDVSRNMQFLRFDATDAGEHDRSVEVEIGQIGRWRAAADFDQTPYLHTALAAAIHNYYGEGRLLIPDGAQKEFESASEGDIPRLAAQLISEAGRRRLAVQRDRTRGRFDLRLTRNWTVHAGAREEARNGQRPLSIGAFEPLAGPGPAFALTGFEVPAAIEIRTSELTAGTSFHTTRFGVDLGVVYSRFRNSMTDILYDNPFRFTDSAAHPLYSSRVISADWPSTSANSAILAGYFNLTDQIHLATALGWTRIVQTEKFTSYTVNHAIASPPGFPPGLGPVNKETLPRDTLDGRVTTKSLEHAVAWELTPRATLRIDYRDLDTADQTPDLDFPGYVGSGDAAWQTEFDGQALSRPPLSLRHREARIDLDWEPVRPLSLRAEYRHEDRERGGRRGGSAEQQSIAGRAIARFGTGSFASLFVEHADRRANSAGITSFDLAGRKRLTIRAQGDWAPPDLESFSVGASFSDQRTEFDEGPPLRNLDVREASVALRWLIAQRMTVTGDITRSDIRHSQVWAGIPDGQAWRRATRDDVTDVGLSFEEAFRDGRLTFAFRATGSFASQRVETRSAGDSPVVTHDWPDIRNGLKDLAGGIEYAFSDRLQVGLRHIYEIYTIDDFAWSALSPYPLESLDDDTDARRLLFLDTRGSGYHAHQVGLYVRTKLR